MQYLLVKGHLKLGMPLNFFPHHGLPELLELVSEMELKMQKFTVRYEKGSVLGLQTLAVFQHWRDQVHSEKRPTCGGGGLITPVSEGGGRATLKCPVQCIENSLTKETCKQWVDRHRQILDTFSLTDAYFIQMYLFIHPASLPVWHPLAGGLAGSLIWVTWDSVLLLSLAFFFLHSFSLIGEDHLGGGGGGSELNWSLLHPGDVVSPLFTCLFSACFFSHFLGPSFFRAHLSCLDSLPSCWLGARLCKINREWPPWASSLYLQEWSICSYIRAI